VLDGGERGECGGEYLLRQEANTTTTKGDEWGQLNKHLLEEGKEVSEKGNEQFA